MVIEFLPLHEGVEVPVYATVGAAGCDLKIDNFKIRHRAGNDNPDIFPLGNWSIDNPDFMDRISLKPGERTLIGCGFAIAIPEGYQMEIRTRSGKALKQGLVVLNSPGTIDSDYRGEIGAILLNTSKDEIRLRRGESIAQGVITKFDVAVFKVVDKLPDTERGEGGFGSTDKKQPVNQY